MCKNYVNPGEIGARYLSQNEDQSTVEKKWNWKNYYISDMFLYFEITKRQKATGVEN